MKKFTIIIGMLIWASSLLGQEFKPKFNEYFEIVHMNMEETINLFEVRGFELSKESPITVNTRTKMFVFVKGDKVVGTITIHDDWKSFSPNFDDKNHYEYIKRQVVNNEDWIFVESNSNTNMIYRESDRYSTLLNNKVYSFDFATSIHEGKKSNDTTIYIWYNIEIPKD